MKYEAQEHVTVMDLQGKPYLIVEDEIVIVELELKNTCTIEYGERKFTLKSMYFHDSFKRDPRRMT